MRRLVLISEAQEVRLSGKVTGITMANAPRWRALPARMSTDRRRVDAFVAQHQLAWDLSMAALALVYIGIGFFQDHPSGVLNEGVLSAAELTITLIFLAEFSLRFYVAPSRRGYLFAHWIDLLALLPAIRWLRFLRLGRLIYLVQVLRVLRLGVLIRFLVELNRVGNQIRWIVMRNGVHVVLTIAVGLVVVGGALVWDLEHTINPAFHDFGDAIWWAFATVTTVGYGNGPVTLTGRVVAAVIMITGVTCYGIITATVTALFLHQPRHDRPAAPDELMAVLEDIRTRLARIEQERGPTVDTIADPHDRSAPSDDRPATTSHL